MTNTTRLTALLFSFTAFGGTALAETPTGLTVTGVASEVYAPPYTFGGGWPYGGLLCEDAAFTLSIEFDFDQSWPASYGLTNYVRTASGGYTATLTFDDSDDCPYYSLGSSGYLNLSDGTSGTGSVIALTTGDHKSFFEVIDSSTDRDLTQGGSFTGDLSRGTILTGNGIRGFGAAYDADDVELYSDYRFNKFTLLFDAGLTADVEILGGTADGDGDGIDDDVDNCPSDTNLDQADLDGDGDGDACDVDDDDDGIDDDVDNCPFYDNAAQSDYDSDGLGDVCDDDDDNDGYADAVDVFPTDSTEWLDSDGDGQGDNADTCFGYPNDDSDSDGVCDSDDVCPTDADDTDADSDNVCDVDDVCIGTDNVDTDGDQVCDSIDVCDGNDAAGDNDSDGYCDDIDNCPADDNDSQADTDGDGIGDACEADSDGDGIIDDDDNCDDDANFDQSDNDGDGDGDVCDSDDDDDGIDDAMDNCPFYDNADQSDYDSDGYGDVCDGDDDADGVADDVDVCQGTPLDAPFDEDGCSGEQRIELECGSPEDYSWRKSGRYIRCVTKESRAAYRGGLITRRERAWLIKRAAFEMWLTRFVSRLRRWC